MLLRAVFDSIDDAVVATDLDLAVTAWNPAAERTYGWPAAEALGRPVADVVGTPADAAEAGRLRAATAAEEPLRLHARHRHRDGSLLAVDSTVVPLRAENGTLTGYVQINRDVTERLGLEARVHQAETTEAVSRLAGVAHDLGSLLASIVANATVLQHRLGAEAPEIEAVLTAAESAGSISRQLLAFGRLQVLAPSLVDPNQLLRELAPVLEQVTGGDIALEWNLARDVGSVEIDPGRLTQVVLNLATNAREAMPDGGTLTILTRNVELSAGGPGRQGGAPPGPYVLVAVADDGVGMDAETRDRMFEPLFTTRDEGTGFGLATVYDIVGQAGGQILVDSAPSLGTKVEIYLPRPASGPRTASS